MGGMIWKGREREMQWNGSVRHGNVEGIFVGSYVYVLDLYLRLKFGLRVIFEGDKTGRGLN